MAEPLQWAPLGPLLNDVLLLPVYVTVPPAAVLSFIGVYSTTYPQHIRTLRWFRLVLAVPCCFLWLAVMCPKGFPIKLSPTMCSIAFLGLLRSWNAFVVGFGDAPQDVPKWVALKFGDKGHGLELVDRVPLPLPTSATGRAAYAIDVFCSLRGASFFKDTAFDFALKPIAAYRSGGLWRWWRHRFLTTLFELAITAAIKFSVSPFPYDTTKPYPLTTVPSLPHQLSHSLQIGLFVFYGTFLPAHLIQLMVVPLFRLNPDSFAPTYQNLAFSENLSDFWSNRWHQNCRLTMVRAQAPLERFFKPHLPARTLHYVRIIGTFAVSTLVHLVAPIGLRGGPHRIVFWETSNIWFFMSQPLGLFIEEFVVTPYTERWAAGWRAVVRRGFVLGWIVWTGRWYADGFILYGVLADGAYAKALNKPN